MPRPADSPDPNNAEAADSKDPAGKAQESADEPELTVSLPKAPSKARDASPIVPAPPPPDTVRVSTTLSGRYELRRPLGSGGYGDVFLGHDLQLQRPVAIKLLRPGPGPGVTEGAPSLQEARKLARLSHPGIVAVHDVGVHERQVFIISDYLDGPDLRRWLRDNRPRWPEATRLVASVADALSHAHSRLIVHRDVKPANIILTEDRGPVLVDFGIALSEGEAGGRERGLRTGTPNYMSPEQADGTAHRIDGRTDIYSLGVVLYELLTGRVPFVATNLQELLLQLRDDEPQPPRQLAREIPPELERICLKALSKRQQDRYTTAGDFAEDLRGVLATATATPAVVQVSPSPAPDTPPEQTAGPTPTWAQRTDREAERRQLTVLVCGCDVFESETYLEFDVEDQARMLRAFQEACQQAVDQFGGTVVQSTEKGLLACFGYPVAYEDAARRAARSGLTILDVVKTLGEQSSGEVRMDLNPWIGIHTGPAIAESKEGAISLVGEARNVALRLEEVAVPGSVICTDASHRMFQGRFECGTLGAQKFRGVSQPVEVFRVERIAVAGSLLDAVAPSDLSPLTGRDLEVGLLKDRWEQAREGMGQVVLLIGEPGLGKSRLVHTMKQHVLGEKVEGEVDSPVIEWRCSPHFQNTRLYPAIDFYERALDFDREEPEQDRFERLLHRLQQYGLARSESVPLWASLLSLPTPEEFPPLSLSPVRQREETFRAMLDWLHTRADRKPVLFVVEDLHWVDASTLEFLGQFLAEGLHDSILTLLTFRPEFKTPWPAVAHQTSLALNRLTGRQAAELMRKKAGAALPDALINQVYDRTGGVPLFIEEFTRMVQESGALEQGGESDTPTWLKREIPATLQDLVMARLDRMEGEREVAQLAATLGREFSHELLTAVADLDEPALEAELAKLVQAEILYQKGRPPQCSYIFKHALLEDALYNALIKSKRQQFHKRIGEVLEAQFPQTVETRPELLAHHFTEAGLAERAVGYWLRAALRSRDRSANVEAIGHLTKGVELVRAFAESPERDAQELQFLTALAPAYIEARGYAAPEVGPVLQRARELCRAIGEPQMQLGVMLGMWEWRIVRADLRLCPDLAAEGMALAEQQNDPGMLMEALFMPGVTMFYRAQFAAARGCFENALAGYDDRERTRFWTAYTGHNAGVTHRCYLALVLWHLGYPDQAFKVAREMCKLARAIGHPYSLCHAVDFTAFLYFYCRLGAEVQAAAEEELAIGIEQGFPLWHACGILHAGAAMLLQGQREEALARLDKGLSAFRATGAEIRVPSYLGLLGEAYTKGARFEDAHKALDDGLATAEKNDDRCHEAELHRLKGELHLAEANDRAAAEECFRRAIETARRQQSRGWELRATMSLARLWQGQGRRDEAGRSLATVYNTYTEGFNTPDLVDAKTLLVKLAEPAASAR